MDSILLINCMGSLFLMIAVGFVCARIGLVDKAGTKSLSSLIINVALSAKIIDSMVNTDVTLTGDTAKNLILAIIIAYGLWWVMGLLFRPFAPKEKRGIYHFMVLFGNIGFLGYPLVTVLYGEENVFYAALFNIPFNILVYTYGIYLLKGSGGEKLRMKSFLNAPIVAVAISFLLMGLSVKLPTAIGDAVGYLSDLTVPGAMLVVGLSLGHAQCGALLKNWRLYALSFATLILRPVVCSFFLRLFVRDPIILSVSILLSTVPVAANTTALCVEYEQDEGLASAAVLVTTALSIFTIPLMGMLLL